MAATEGQFCLMISRVLLIDSRSVSIPPPVVGVGGVIVVHFRFVVRPAPARGGRYPAAGVAT